MKDGALVQTDAHGVSYQYRINITASADEVRYTYVLKRPQKYTFKGSRIQFEAWSKPVAAGSTYPFPMFQCIEARLPKYSASEIYVALEVETNLHVAPSQPRRELFGVWKSSESGNSAPTAFLNRPFV